MRLKTSIEIEATWKLNVTEQVELVALVAVRRSCNPATGFAGQDGDQ